MPRIMIWPTSTFKLAAAVKGPGVGGTMAWVICKPQANERAKLITDIPVTEDMALTRGAKITIAESAKTGI